MKRKNLKIISSYPSRSFSSGDLVLNRISSTIEYILRVKIRAEASRKISGIKFYVDKKIISITHAI